MMMAHDSSSLPPTIDEETLSVLRSALRGYVRDGESSATLRRALQRVSEEARRREIRAEQLLVILKELWGAIPEVRYSTRAGPQNDRLREVITICIELYYGSESGE